MDVVTLAPNATGDRNLLRGLRRAFDGAQEATLCVAFASEAGVHLLKDVLQPIAKTGNATLVVTTTFGTSTPAALRRAVDMGIDVRVHNPGSGTFHPKLYVARRDDQVSVVIGSANLTGGLVNNIELATMLSGEMREKELAFTLEWSRELCERPDVLPWKPTSVAVEEALTPALEAAIRARVATNHTVMTLGPQPAANEIVEVLPTGVYVQTERSAERGGPQFVPAWMIQLAWDYLATHGELTNKTLLNDLRVHRSSFVIALLAALPGVVGMKSPVGVRLHSS